MYVFMFCCESSLGSMIWPGEGFVDEKENVVFCVNSYFVVKIANFDVKIANFDVKIVQIQKMLKSAFFEEIRNVLSSKGTPLLQIGQI